MKRLSRCLVGISLKLSLISCSSTSVKENELVLRIGDSKVLIEYEYCLSKCFLPPEKQVWTKDVYDLNDPNSREILRRVGFIRKMIENNK